MRKWKNYLKIIVVKIRTIFILGSGYCGSTLLDLILDSHSKIVGIEEFEDFRNFIHHEIGGNRMRLKTDSKTEEDIEWKQKMPKKYKILFNLLFSWLNFYCKYKK